MIEQKPFFMSAELLFKESQEQTKAIQSLHVGWELCRKNTEESTQALLIKKDQLLREKIALQSQLAQLQSTHVALEKAKQEELKEWSIRFNCISDENTALNRIKAYTQQLAPLVHTVDRGIDDLSAPKKYQDYYNDMFLILKKIIQD